MKEVVEILHSLRIFDFMNDDVLKSILIFLLSFSNKNIVIVFTL